MHQVVMPSRASGNNCLGGTVPHRRAKEGQQTEHPPRVRYRESHLTKDNEGSALPLGKGNGWNGYCWFKRLQVQASSRTVSTL